MSNTVIVSTQEAIHADTRPPSSYLARGSDEEGASAGPWDLTNPGTSRRDQVVPARRKLPPSDHELMCSMTSPNVRAFGRVLRSATDTGEMS